MADAGLSAARNELVGGPAPSSAQEGALLCNPSSFRMAQADHLARLESMAVGRGVIHFRVRNAESTMEAVAQAVRTGARWVAVAAGDGTLQAVAAALLRHVPEPRRPALVMLGGGRTNFTARDLELRGSAPDQFARLLQKDPRQLRRIRRAVLHVGQDGGFSEYGFFLAGALVDEVIRDCHAYRGVSRGRLRTGAAATPWRLMQLGGLAALGRRRFRTPELVVDAPPLGRLEGAVRLLVCSTLQHSRGLLNPYAERGRGAVRLTVVRADAERFAGRVARLIRGRFNEAMSPAQGYLSGRCERATILGLDSITLDGQEHALDPGRAVVLSAPAELEFVAP